MKTKINSNHILVFENRNFKAPELAKTILADYLEKELLISALDKDPLKSNKAMWILSHCAELNFSRIKPFQVKLINHLKSKNLYSGVIRSILHIFQKQPVPKKQQSFMLDKCFEYIKNPSEAIAVRAFAIKVVFNISKSYPDLLNELALVLNQLNITEESAAIKARTKNTLKDIVKLRSKL